MEPDRCSDTAMTASRHQQHSPRLAIRPAISADVDPLVAVLSADLTGHPPNDPARDIPATFRCPAARIFVAERDKAIVGTVTASWNGRNGELRYLWIADSLRRTRWVRPIFDGLRQAAMDYLRGAGMQRVLLFVRRGAEAPKQLRTYERELGARVVDPIVMAFELDEDADENSLERSSGMHGDGGGDARNSSA